MQESSQNESAAALPTGRDSTSGVSSSVRTEADTESSFFAIEELLPLDARIRAFPLLFVLASVAAVVCGHWLAYETLGVFSRIGAPPAAIAIAAVVALVVLAFRIFESRFAHGTGLPGILFVCIPLWLLDLASLGIHKAVLAPSGLLELGDLLAAFLGVFVVAASYAHRTRARIIGIRSLQVFRWGRRPEVSPPGGAGKVVRQREPATDLLILLSPPNIVPAVNSEFCEFSNGKDLVRIDRTMNLQSAIAVLGKFWINWQQLLRGIEPHLRTVQRIHLVGSPPSGDGYEPAPPGLLDPRVGGKQGSDMYVPLCTGLLRLFVSGDIAIRRVAALDMTDVETLSTRLTALVTEIAAEHPGSRVVVETTGATKAASIAGAVATLNTEATFQYVDTNDPYDALLHDMRIDQEPKL